MEHELLKIGEAAEWLRVKERTLREWVRRGSIEAFRVGGQLRFRRSDLEHWVESGSTLAQDWEEDEEAYTADPVPATSPTPRRPSVVLDLDDGSIH